MNIPPDYLIERKSHKSQIKKWKLVALCILLILIVISSRKLNFGSSAKLIQKDYIASILINEEIVEDAKRDKRLEEISEDDYAKALIVNVNSPGGSVVGAEKIYNIFRKISKKKPVVIIMGTLATSGAYLISLGGDYIISHNGTITGSIGVIMQTAEATELAEKLGIKFNNFKSSELKAAPNPTEKVTPAVQEVIMSNIYDTYDYFVELIVQRRGFSHDEARKIADGRVYSGRQALKLKLVDAIGTKDDAIKWLQEVKNIDSKLKVKEIEIKYTPQILDKLLEDFSSMITFGFFKNKFDGLKSIY